MAGTGGAHGGVNGGGNGGAIMTSRRVRGQSRGMQNSQRVHDAKPRTAAVSHRGRCGASREARRPSIATYRNGARVLPTARGGSPPSRPVRY